MKEKRLPSEWEKQEFIQLIWPHNAQVWGDDHLGVQQCFVEIVTQITIRQPLVLVVPDVAAFRKAYPELLNPHVSLFEAPSNDCWARDSAPITILEEGRPKLLKFKFNGWGLKFPANLDNQIAHVLHKKKAYGKWEMGSVPMVLEGGSIESDGQGTLLTTTECLLSKNRNEHLSKTIIETRLKQWLGVKKILWLSHGSLLGDDTDSHVDILARMAPNEQLLYVQCTDQQDPHFETLGWMESQLKDFTNCHGQPFKLLPLPLPKVHNKAGDRLAASYANFLIINHAVLLPIYQQPEDAAAIETLSKAFPDREIVPIDCRALITQGGSLHCTSMHFPSAQTL